MLFYMQLCFSYRGYLPSWLVTRTYVTRTNGHTIHPLIYYRLSPDRFPSSPSSWTRRCINMFRFFTQYSAYASEGIEFASSLLRIQNTNADLWIDEVSIQQQQNQSKVFCIYINY